jgi:hypothetical protein
MELKQFPHSEIKVHDAERPEFSSVIFQDTVYLQDICRWLSVAGKERFNLAVECGPRLEMNPYR